MYHVLSVKREYCIFLSFPLTALVSASPEGYFSCMKSNLLFGVRYFRYYHYFQLQLKSRYEIGTMVLNDFSRNIIFISDLLFTKAVH